MKQLDAGDHPSYLRGGHQMRTMQGLFVKLVAVFLFAGVAQVASLAAFGGEGVALVQEGGAWSFRVDGKPYFVKGFTWSHTPVGFKYDYDLFAKDEAAIRAALDRDMPLIRAAGGNTLRGEMPAKWLDYIHKTYGMRVMVNDFCGRYGMMIGGQWVPAINYADPATRAQLIENWKAIAARNKDLSGVLCYAIGNENNYGLEWQSAEIENLPAGERHAAKAKFLYSLFNDIAKEVKKIDPAHPVGIVNGDLQYLELIVKECPDIDFLGVNAYRGKEYGPMFSDVKAKFGKPVLLTETGCDAFNAKTGREDQDAQAEFIAAQWRDLYRNAYANGGAGNCLGALVFEWADEWWKQGQQVRLDEQDTQGVWKHEAFYDAAPNLNNMNEEWFGICSIHRTELDKAHVITPRVAYYTLKKIWAADPRELGPDGLQTLFSGITSGKAVEEKTSAAKKVTLPAVVYEEGDKPGLWAASGYMGNTGAVRQNPDCTDNPHTGKTCLEFSYTAAKDWAGVVWQDPANDWGAAAGGYDLTGAKKLTLWARGKNGGEKIKIEAGILDKKAKYPDSSKLNLGEIVLTKEWKQYEVNLAGKDLSRIKTGLSWVVAGQGSPLTFYLDDVRYE